MDDMTNYCNLSLETGYISVELVEIIDDSIIA